MRIRLLVSVAVTILLPCAPGSAARPRVGVVLSGAGEGSVVNVGALKGLEELRVPIDAIVGTGMGAVIAGAYASGTPITEMVQIFSDIEWSEFLTDAPVIDYFPSDTVGPSSLLLASPYAMSGRRFDLLLQALLSRAPGETLLSFDDLAVPFRSVSADLQTAEVLVLSSGSLVAALRPNILSISPWSLLAREGRMVLDVPGITRPVAVAVARQMGVDVVVFVLVPAPASPPGDPPPELRLTYQVLDLYTMAADSEIARFADILVVPETIGQLSGGKTEDAIQLGVEAVLSLEPSFAPLCLNEADYRFWRERFRRQP